MKESDDFLRLCILFFLSCRLKEGMKKAILDLQTRRRRLRKRQIWEDRGEESLQDRETNSPKSVLVVFRLFSSSFSFVFSAFLTFPPFYRGERDDKGKERKKKAKKSRKNIKKRRRIFLVHIILGNTTKIHASKIFPHCSCVFFAIYVLVFESHTWPLSSVLCTTTGGRKVGPGMLLPLPPALLCRLGGKGASSSYSSFPSPTRYIFLVLGRSVGIVAHMGRMTSKGKGGKGKWLAALSVGGKERRRRGGEGALSKGQ